MSAKPRGRPKGSKNRNTILRAIAAETLIVRAKGASRRLTMLESVVLSLRSKALVEKNHAAIHEFQRLIARYQPEAAEGGGYLVVPETLTSEERLARETERNKVRKPPAELEMFEPSDEGEDRS